MLTSSFVVLANHPSLAGHFAGNPITPGVVTLDHVVRGLTSQLPGTTLDGLPQVKFLRPLLPGVEVIVTYEPKHRTLYQFIGKSDGNVILSGQIRLVLEEA